MTAPLTRDERARRLAVLAVISDWVKKEDQRLRGEMAAELVPGDRQSALLDPANKDTLLGFVTLVKGRQSWRVTDESALLDWVKRNAPTEVVTVQSVRPSFVTALINECKTHGGWISPEGELMHPDGLETSIGTPYIQVKATAEADGLVADALRGGRLQLMPGTEAGE